MNNKTDAMDAFVLELTNWIATTKEIAILKETFATFKGTEAANRGDLLNSQSDLQDKQMDLDEAEMDLDEERMTAASDLALQQNTNLPLKLTAKETALNKKYDDLVTLLDSDMDIKKYRATEAITTQEDIHDQLWPVEKASLNKVASAQINKIGKEAEIAANTKLTSQLTHLLT